MESVEILVKKYKKMGTAQVISQMGRVKGNAKLACIEVLKSRNQDVSQWEEEGLTEEFSPKQEKPVVEHLTKRIVFELEPEEDLTEEEKRILAKYEAEREEDPISVRLRAEKNSKNSKIKVEKLTITKKTKTAKTKFLESKLFTIGDLVNTKSKSGEQISGLVTKIDKDKEDNFWLQLNVNSKILWRQETKCWI